MWDKRTPALHVSNSPFLTICLHVSRHYFSTEQEAELREVNSLAQGHTASKPRSGELNPCLSLPGSLQKRVYVPPPVRTMLSLRSSMLQPQELVSATSNLMDQVRVVSYPSDAE